MMIFHAKNKNNNNIDWNNLTEAEKSYYFNLAASCEADPRAVTALRLAQGKSLNVLRRKECGVCFFYKSLNILSSLFSLTEI